LTLTLTLFHYCCNLYFLIQTHITNQDVWTNGVCDAAGES
jgi:hypothetical protein